MKKSAELRSSHGQNRGAADLRFASQRASAQPCNQERELCRPVQSDGRKIQNCKKQLRPTGGGSLKWRANPVVEYPGTTDKPVQNDAPVLPRQFQYEPGFFLKVLAQNGTFENRNLNTMRSWFQKIKYSYVHKKVLQNTTAKSHEKKRKRQKKNISISPTHNMTY